MEVGEALVGWLGKVEHLLSRNSGISSNPLSTDDDLGELAPPEKTKRDKDGPKRSRGKQSGGAGIASGVDRQLW